jgi:anti-sigma regulatory factor (Ser/Thr protein kinase)
VERGELLVTHLMDTLAAFSGPNHEQEDDITLLVVERETAAAASPAPQSLDEFDLPCQPGSERQVCARVLESISALGLSPLRQQRLETAVAEAAMNAMEHGNHYQPDLPVHVQVLCSPEQVLVRILDHGPLREQSQGDEFPAPEMPDLQAKLDGLQSPRGWGLFLIKNMVDEMNIRGDGEHHIIELVLNIKEG